MAVDRINSSGGINGRPVELIISDDESSPAVARQKTSKMVQESNIDAHVGGFSPTFVSPACRFGRRPRSST